MEVSAPEPNRLDDLTNPWQIDQFLDNWYVKLRPNRRSLKPLFHGEPFDAWHIFNENYDGTLNHKTPGWSISPIGVEIYRYAKYLIDNFKPEPGFHHKCYLSLRIVKGVLELALVHTLITPGGEEEPNFFVVWIAQKEEKYRYCVYGLPMQQQYLEAQYYIWDNNSYPFDLVTQRLESAEDNAD
jgi:hypothetical protein